MADTPTSWLQTASQRMTWLAERQKVIAENIANADTPGYNARDVESFDDYLGKAPGSAVSVDYAKSEWGRSLDGNGVILEEQSILAASVSGQYRLASKLYSKAHQMIATVNGK
ncbi:flagellar basal body rod protein FlgB [Leisingera caerulea]|uniref:flagellar basal body rod protein FlgB n=1 Tax=Leisingera caerulea TaxID=506591 RepID=UPI0004806284|nr:flagellar basal body protein [Leisingera caerulea]